MRPIVVIAVLTAVASPATANPKDPEAAKQLFVAGRTLHDQHKYLEACVLFERSYELDPAVGTRLNLAECAERAHKPREAWLLWMSAAEEFDRASDPRAKFAHDHADALAPELGTIVVRVARPRTRGLALRIGDRKVEPAKTVIERVDAGTVHIKATAPRREPFETEITVATGEEVTVDVPKLHRRGPVDQDSDDDEDRPSAGLWWGLATGGAIVVIGGLGYEVYAAGRVRDIENGIEVYPTPQERDDAGNTWATRANVAEVIAAAGLVVTTTCVIKGVLVRREARRAATSLRIVPVASRRLAGAMLRLSW